MTSAAPRQRAALADETQFVLELDDDNDERNEIADGSGTSGSTFSIASTSHGGKNHSKGQQRGYEYARHPPQQINHSMNDDDTLPQYDSVNNNDAEAGKDPYHVGDEDDDVDVDVDGDEEPDEKVYRYAKKLPNPATLKNANKKQPGIVPVLGGLAVLICFGYLLSYASTAITRHGHITKVNVILMISDGFGPASETFARQYLQFLHSTQHPSILKNGRWYDLGNTSTVPASDKDFYSLKLPLDDILIGASRTRSSDSLVTDSAAGATAFSCAIKTYNGAIGVEPFKRDPCGTVLEAARHKGYKTGLVVTSRITHATPASFYAHVPDRDMESKIAEQLVLNHPLGQQVDIAFGGGLCFFLPNTSVSSCRSDNLDLIKAAQDNKKNAHPKYKVITTRKEFDALGDTASNVGTIGLFSRDHMEYELDRLAMSISEEEREPTLSAMADKALRILRSSVRSDSAHGFFLMIEGSRIDMAAHSNDPAGHVNEILSYQNTIKAVRRHVDELNAAGSTTVMISVSDHETGGLSLAYQLPGVVYPEYAWYPDALTNATRTSVKVAKHIHEKSETIGIEDIRRLLKDELGVSDPSDAELNAVIAQKDDNTLWFLDHALSRLTSARAQVGWSTEGHSGVDVNLYGYPRALVAPSLGGNRENTEIGTYIVDLMKLDLDQITTSLQSNAKAWYSAHSNKLDVSMLDAFGKHEGNASEHDTTRIMHYHGEHRH